MKKNEHLYFFSDMDEKLLASTSPKLIVGIFVNLGIIKLESTGEV